MTHIDTGIYGAKVQSWAAKNPRDVLKRLIDDNPDSDKGTVFNLFLDEVRSEDAEEYLVVVIEYWFANNYNSLAQTPDHKRIMSKELFAERQARVEAVKSKIKSSIQKQAQILLLDMMMPNGKTLGECTGRECTGLGNKVGGWLACVAAELKADERVVDVLSEDQLREFYERSNA